MKDELSLRSRSSSYSKNYGLIKAKKQLTHQDCPEDSFQLSSPKTYQPHRSFFRHSKIIHSEVDRPLMSYSEQKNKINKYKIKKLGDDRKQRKWEIQKDIVAQLEKRTKLKVSYQESREQIKETSKQTYPEFQTKNSVQTQSPLPLGKLQKIYISQLNQIPEEDEYQERKKSKLASQHPQVFRSQLVRTRQKQRTKTKVLFQFGDSHQKIKQILKFDKNKRPHITIKIPSFFQEGPNPFLSPQQLQFKSNLFFEQVKKFPSKQSPPQKVHIVHNPECLMASFNEGENKKFCITWYSDGSVYCGEVEYDRRHGMGMEWIPGLYVYYGNYVHNYRSGYGVMKYNSEDVYVGMWARDKYNGFGRILNKDGVMVESGNYKNSELRVVGDFRQLI